MSVILPKITFFPSCCYYGVRTCLVYRCGAVFICTKDLAGVAHSRMGQGCIEVGRFTSQGTRYIPRAAMARRSTGTLNMCSSFGLSFYIPGNLRACMHRHVCLTIYNTTIWCKTKRYSILLPIIRLLRRLSNIFM